VNFALSALENNRCVVEIAEFGSQCSNRTSVISRYSVKVFFHGRKANHSGKSTDSRGELSFFQYFWVVVSDIFYFHPYLGK